MPISEEVRGGVEPWLMARWKAHVDLLLSVVELFFYLLPLTRYKAKRVKTRCFQQGVGQFEAKFQGEGVVPGEYFLVSAKPDTFCYLTVQTAPCYMQLFWHNTGVWQTDGQTDRIAIASTVLAMRALRRAVTKSAIRIAEFYLYMGFAADLLKDVVTRAWKLLKSEPAHL